jgi:short-subunit dehydrogenase
MENLENNTLLIKNTALITGACSCIGFERAKIRASTGDDLVLVVRSTPLPF